MRKGRTDQGVARNAPSPFHLTFPLPLHPPTPSLSRPSDRGISTSGRGGERKRRKETATSPPSPPLGLGPLAGRAAPSLAQRRDRGCFLPTLSRLSLSLSFPRPPGLRRRRAPLFFYRASSEEHSWKKPATRTEKKKALSVSLSGFLIGSAKKGREIEAFYLLRKCFGTAGNWKGE